MESALNLAASKQKLAAFMTELETKRKNPYAGSPLEGVAEEIRKLRKVYGQSYNAIAETLTKAGIPASEKEITAYCKAMLRERVGRKPGSMAGAKAVRAQA